MKKEDKFLKIIGILIIAALVVWLWPVAFHQPFFGSKSSNSVDTIPAPFADNSLPSNVPDMRFGGDGYEDPVTAPTNSNTPSQVTPEPNVPVQQIACTMEAKQCPDGSYVGRQGPKCEFAKCPGEK